MKYIRNIVFIGLFAIGTLFSCKKDVEPIEQELLVTKFDVMGMASEHLKNYQLERDEAFWRRGREYVFVDKNDPKQKIYITVGVHLSKNMAEDALKFHLDNLSAVFNEGQHLGEVIGDNFSWLNAEFDTSILTSINFNRGNVVILMFTHTERNIKDLAKKIDNDIINHANYITYGQTISPPVIDSLTVSKTTLLMGDTVKVIVNATDPDNEKLEYLSDYMHCYETDPKNIFTKYVIPFYIDEPFYGPHKYQFLVINESNVVSQTKEIELLVTE